MVLKFEFKIITSRFKNQTLLLPPILIRFKRTMVKKMKGRTLTERN